MNPETASSSSGEKDASYQQILKSSAIIGGANGLNYLVGIIRTKMIAILLGPSGVGLVDLYLSATAAISTFSGLGIVSSGVREIAEANGGEDRNEIAATAKTLRRICWLSGLTGWAISAALSIPLSKWIMGSGNHAWAIAILGSTVFLGIISGGQNALLEGIRRIGDIARVQVIAMLLNTAITLGFYAWLRDKGIVPVLVFTAAVNLSVSWYFVRRVKPEEIKQSWKETFHRSKRLISLGLAFMWSSLLTALVTLGVRVMISRELGLEANGIYQSAWSISGMFAGFILSAMGTDFYPRLTGISSDHREVNRLVNEQTEIGVLLALPGILGTMTFAPWLMHLLYSPKFLQGAPLLPWFLMGIFGQVVSWPLAYILIAKGEKGWFAASETIANILKFILAASLLIGMGLIGTSIAYPILYLIYTIGMLVITRHLTGFRWNRQVGHLLGIAGILIVLGFCAARFLPEIPALIAGATLSSIAGVFSLRGLASRIGTEHRLIRAFLKIPGGRFLLPS